MGKIRQQDLGAENVSVNVPHVHIATVTPADKKDVKRLLKKSTKGDNGRSNWVWLRLANGDLYLATAPQGRSYEELEHLGV